ncbi:MAG: Zn-ribbon domain-containing OB-fold protein [Candidatus Thorarchaeota archaeon]
MNLDGHGSVLSYTVLEVPPEGFEPPILMALVEIEQGAVVLSTGGKDDIESIRIGAPVELESGPDGQLSFTILAR